MKKETSTDTKCTCKIVICKKEIFKDNLCKEHYLLKRRSQILVKFWK